MGKSWRTAVPESATLGGYGIRTVVRDGIIFSDNGSIPTTKLQTRRSKARTVSYESVKEATAEVSQEELGKLGLSYSEIASKGYKVVLTKLSNTRKIAEMLESKEISIPEDYLALSALRFITGVAQIFDDSQTTKVDVSGTANVDAIEQFDGKIILTGKAGEKIVLNYDDGATVAYKYARICWNSNGTINYLQEEAPNPWYLFWSNAFDCAKPTLEKKPN